MGKAKERRKMERFQLEIPARIQVTGHGKEGRKIELPTRDICADGAYFQTPEPLAEGTPVKVDMILALDRLKRRVPGPHRAAIKVTGRVLRSESAGMAISFNQDYEIRPHRGAEETP